MSYLIQLERTSGSRDVLDSPGLSSSYRQTGEVPGPWAGRRAAAVDFNAMGRAADRDRVRAGEGDTLDDYASSGSTEGRRVTLVNDNSVLSAPGSLVVAVYDVLDRGSGSGCVSLDPKSLDIVGDRVSGDGDAVDGGARGDGSDGNTVSASARVVGESDGGSPVDRKAIILIDDSVSGNRHVICCDIEAVRVGTSGLTARLGVSRGTSGIVNGDTGDGQGASINSNSPLGRVDDFEIFECPRDADAHHRIWLGCATTSAETIPILITISDELMAAPVERH